MTTTLILAATALAVTAMLCVAALARLARLARAEAARARPPRRRRRAEAAEDEIGVRIELAAVRERLKKLEAIASGRRALGASFALPPPLWWRDEQTRTSELGLGARLVIGGIAGFVATMAMTSAMRRLHARLPAKERYPLTPREIVDAALEPPPRAAPDLTLAAHFAYGAGCGALIAAASPRIGRVTGVARRRRHLAGELYGLDPGLRRAEARDRPSAAAQRGDDRRPFRLGLVDRRGDARARARPRDDLRRRAGPGRIPGRTLRNR